MLYSSLWRWFSQKLKPIADIDMGQKKIRGLPTADFPALDTDAVTKKYVDDLLLAAESEETLDNFEYPDDEAAQAAYVTNAALVWDKLIENWDALGIWADGDGGGAVSSIDPAGQLYLDCRAMTGDGSGKRSKDIGAFGAGDFTVNMRFKGDVWDSGGAVGDSGIKKTVEFGTNHLALVIANIGGGDGDGIWVYDGAAYVKVVTKTWDNDWHTIHISVHNSQTDADIYVDDSLEASDADMTFVSGDDGPVAIYGYGSITGNGEYHIDYIRIGSGVYPPSLQCYSEDAIKQQGNYSLKSIAAQTHSLNKTLTRQIGAPINLASSDLIKLYIRSSRTGQNVKIGIKDVGGIITEITPNITIVNEWHMIAWDISEVLTGNKDAIDKIIVTITNANAENIFYLDFMFAIVTQVSAGARYWLELLDTPSTFTGQANKLIRVKADESGLEFVSVPGGGDMLKSVYDPDEDGRVLDSDKLEGLTKAQVRAHTPVSHALSAHSVPVSNIDMDGKNIDNLADPEETQQAATKAYADTKLGPPDYESDWTLIDNEEVHDFEHNLNSLNLLFLAYSANASSPTEWIDLFAPEERLVTQNALGSKNSNIVQLVNNLGGSKYFKLLVWKLD